MNETNNKSLKDLHAITRGQLIGKYGSAIITCLTVSVTEVLILMLVSSDAPTDNFSYLIKIAISIIVDLLMGVLIYGQTYYFLQLVRGDQKLTPGYVFYGLKNNMDKAILVEGIFTLISCIMLVPVVLINTGVIYVSDGSYTKVSLAIELIDLVIRFVAKLYIGLSFYIMCDHPEYSVKEIVEKSIELMNGRKVKLVLVYLSTLPLVIAGFLSCCIGLLWLAPYFQTLLANFYLDAIGEEPHTYTSPNVPMDDANIQQ